MATANPVVECTPAALAAVYPCVKCLDSQQQKWAAIVYILFRLKNGPSAVFSVDDLNADAACFTSIPDAELLDYLINALAKLAIVNGDLAAAPTVSDTACLQCEDVLPLKQKAIYLLCGYLNTLSTPEIL